VVKDEVDLREELRAVQHELEIMISARSVCPFDAREARFFDSLLERETELLRAVDGLAS
jgi:hypothetical protein